MSGIAQTGNGAKAKTSALLQAEFKASQMLTIPRSGKDWDWGEEGRLQRS
jgi:hypothetical protein